MRLRHRSSFQLNAFSCAADARKLPHQAQQKYTHRKQNDEHPHASGDSCIRIEQTKLLRRHKFKELVACATVRRDNHVGLVDEVRVHFHEDIFDFLDVGNIRRFSMCTWRMLLCILTTLTPGHATKRDCSQPRSISSTRRLSRRSFGNRYFRQQSSEKKPLSTCSPTTSLGPRPSVVWDTMKILSF